MANALVFVVDKSLLTGKSVLGRPVRYAFFSGLFAAAAVVILPWAPVWPSAFLIYWSVIAGLCHLAALWLFFTVLKKGEPSRVVPIVGSAVPLFTLIFAGVVLGERWSAWQLAGVAALIVGGAVLSVRVDQFKKVRGKLLVIILLSGALFAAYFSLAKYIYDFSGQSFLAAFAYSRIVEGLLALVVLGPIIYLLPKEKKLKRRKKSVSVGIGSVFVGNKVLAAGAFLLQSYAISLGSVTVVNALQGTQYVFLLILAAAVSVWWPGFFKEEMGRVVLGQKAIGIALVGCGLALLV